LPLATMSKSKLLFIADLGMLAIGFSCFAFQLLETGEKEVVIPQTLTP